MGFEAPKFTSFSQPRFPERGRALTTFIAVAASVCRAEYSPVIARRRSAWIVAGACVLAYLVFGSNATGAFDLALRGLLPIAALIVVILLVPGSQVFGSLGSAKRFTTINRLDRIRTGIGIENGLDPQWITLFEPSAQHWERIENSLQSDYWSSRPADRSEVERAVIARIVDAMGVDTAGHIVDHVKALNEFLRDRALFVATPHRSDSEPGPHTELIEG